MGTRRSRGRRLLGWCALLVLTASWFVWLRPTALGGRESYVVVDGHSMDGTYRDGDLVIVREEDGYDVGDIIAFRAGGEFDDPTRIIHRIVDRAEADRFITQGDNRDRVDPWAPGPEDIIGRAVLRVPRAGAIAQSAAHPQVLAALGGAAVFAGGRTRRRRRQVILRPERPTLPVERPRPARPIRSGPPRWLRHTEPRWAFAGVVTCVALLVPVLGLAWAVMRASDTTVRTDRFGAIDYGVGADYRFIGDASPVYPTGVVEMQANEAGALVPSGPLFAKLLHRLELVLTFEIQGTGTDELTSSYGADVVVSTSGGWSDVVQVIEPTPFEGRAAQPIAIDLDETRARVAQVDELTGIGSGDQFTLTVTPRLEVAASGGGQTVDQTLSPPLAFVVNGGLITAEAVRQIDDTAELAREIRVRSRYGMGPVSPGTHTARGLLAGLALVLLGALAWFASVLFGGIGLREADRIAARYRSQMVDVAGATAPPGPVVVVSAIDELVRMAKVDQSVILHEDLGDGSHRYRVFLGAVTYEYETMPEHAGSAAGSSDTARGSGRT